MVTAKIRPHNKSIKNNAPEATAIVIDNSIM